jgi:c-di-GMP-related signal transduction protein
MEFIARQPIFDVRRKVVGYELLFRSSEENRCAEPDLDLASRKTMATAMLMGLDVLSGGNTIYLNCTEALLCGGYPTLFPAQQTVVEVLETVKPSPAVVSACRDLKSAGYTIALDDFEDGPGQAPLAELADIIKVDFRLSSSTERAALIRRYGKNGRVMLAEKVESDKEFCTAANQGYNLFQGFFFCRPKVLCTRSVKSLNPQHARILRILGHDTLDFREVEQLIKSDPALCFRLLRYLNSAAFCFQREIRSILEAVSLLGETELRKWLFLVSAIVSGRSHPELVTLALVRARFAERLGPCFGISGSLLFFLGLLSLMDTILDLPMSLVTEMLAIPPEVHSALLGEPGRMRDCLDLVVAYEKADWKLCDQIGERCQIPLASLMEQYFAALKWTKSLMSI